MIQMYSLRLLETALNLALGQNLPSSLKNLESKVIRICITSFNWSFFIKIADARLVLLSEYDGQPDTVIYSSPVGLIKLSILPASKARSLFHDGIRMEGDVALGQALKKSMDEIDIDWEGHLARFTGDMVAYQLGKGIRGGIRFLNTIHHSFSSHLSNYIQEEHALFPPREAIQDFCDDVDLLALDVERLEAKIKLGCVES